MLRDNIQQAQPTQQPVGQYPPVFVIGLLHQCDPPFFSKVDDEEVEDCLSRLKKVSRHNKWDDPSKWQNVHFHLKHVASLWFHSHESDFANWTAFKKRFAEVFDRPTVRKLRAKQRLRGHAQQQGETFTSYIEDVIDLFKRLNPSMTEQEKVKHIQKGTDDDAFQTLLAKDPLTVSELATLCQSFDVLRKQHVITRWQATPEDSLASLTVREENTTLLSLIKEYVRGEVA